MTDTSSGQSAEHWKRKFCEEIDRIEQKEGEWEKLEALLKRVIRRLSLAAEGHHPTLDLFIRDVRDSVRDKVDSQHLESILEQLSAGLAKIEDRRTSPQRQIAAVLQTLTEALALPESCRKTQDKLVKRIAKAGDEESEPIVKEWLALLKIALAHPSNPAKELASEKGKKIGWLNRLLGAMAKEEKTVRANAPQIPGGDMEIFRDFLLSFLDKLDHCASPNGRLAVLRAMAKDAATRAELDRLSAELAELLSEVRPAEKNIRPARITCEEMQPSAQELLIRLLEQLAVPPDLVDEVDAMKVRLEKEAASVKWQPLLKDVARLINSIRGHIQKEKHEFEDFLQQITDRLKELDGYLQSENTSLQLAEQRSKIFDVTMNSEAQDLRQNVTHAHNLEDLKLTVQNRLDVISQHLKDYRSAEQNRFMDAQNNVVAMQLRITSLEQETDSLKTVLFEKNRQALCDTLTGIPNRLAYEHRAQDEVARWKRFGNPLSLAIWDVDFFKKVNDAYGHKAGDKVLQTIAQLFIQRIRGTDFLARYGGEEFVMLLPGAKEEENLRLANELRKQIEECGFHYHEMAVKITASCGISSFHAGDTLEQVFERADKALYRAKKNGRNQCVIAAAGSDWL